MANRFVFPHQQWFDANGNPGAGWKLGFYKPGTSTKKDTYSDASLSTPNTNPVVADANGVWPDIYLDGTYDVRLLDANDAQKESWNSVEGPIFTGIGGGKNQIPTNAYIGAFVPEILDSGTDAYQGDFGRDVADGEIVQGDVGSANTTTTPTLENTGGAPSGGKTVTTRDGSALWANALDGVHAFQFDSGTDTWLVLDPRWQMAPFWAGHIDGLELANNGTDSDHDIDIATGVCSMRDGSGNRRLFELSSSLTKRIDADWVEGTDSGGFPSGLTLSADTMYIPFSIGKDDGTVDFGWDTDTSASNLLADATDYSWFRPLLEGMWTDGSSNIRGIRQFGDYVWYKTAVREISDSSMTSGSSETVATHVPPNQTAIGMGFGRGTSCTEVKAIVINADDTVSNNVDEGIAATRASANNDTKEAGARGPVQVNGSSQIRYQVDVSGGGSEAADLFVWGTQGWIDDRGRNS